MYERKQVQYTLPELKQAYTPIHKHIQTMPLISSALSQRMCHITINGLGTQHKMSSEDVAVVGFCECSSLLYCSYKKCMKEMAEKGKRKSNKA